MIQIAGVEPCSMVDYDGKIAYTLFTPGCNFKCPFCQNSQLVLPADLHLYNPQQVIDEIVSRKNIIDAICISGGEATLQKDLIPFIQEIKKLGFLIKLDTNGYRPNIIKELLEKNLLDYIAMDIKSSPRNYAEICGLKSINLQPIKDSIALLTNSTIDYEFRTTIISEFHTIQDMRDISNLIAGAKKYALQKYKDNPNCIQQGFTPIDYLLALQFKEIAETTVQSVVLRGY